jgi:hypothetical protein
MGISSIHCFDDIQKSIPIRTEIVFIVKCSKICPKIFLDMKFRLC